MSDRCSFTSEYIYNKDDYKKIREAFEKEGNGRYLCTAPSCGYDTKKEIRKINLNTKGYATEYGEEYHVEIPIVQGHVRGLGQWDCIEAIIDILNELELESDVRFVIVFDYSCICVIDKDCGNTTCNYKCIEFEKIED